MEILFGIFIGIIFGIMFGMFIGAYICEKEIDKYFKNKKPY